MKLSFEPHNFEAFSYLLKIPQKLHKVKNFILKPPHGWLYLSQNLILNTLFQVFKPVFISRKNCTES